MVLGLAHGGVRSPALLGPNDDGTSWGSNNAAKYFDPKFSDQLQQLKSSTEDSAAITKKLVDIANEIQTKAWPYLPTLRTNSPEVVGANVTNVGVSPVFVPDRPQHPGR